jgi:hypothetical protein
VVSVEVVSLAPDVVVVDVGSVEVDVSLEVEL